MMTLLEAVIFDLDGVLVDTIALHQHAWQEVARSGGRDVSLVDMEQLRGLRRDECLQIIFPDMDLSSEKIDSFLSIKNNAYINALFRQTPEDLLTPNALNLIHLIKNRQLKVGVASSSVNASIVLDHVGITSRFDVIAGGHTVSRSKPKPDIFVWVSGALGIHPRNVLVFEDSVAGIDGAKQAGMYTVGIANAQTQHHADTYYDNFSQIDFDDLLVNLDLSLPTQRSLIGDHNVRD